MFFLPIILLLLSLPLLFADPFTFQFIDVFFG
jgi:hypothetical protein